MIGADEVKAFAKSRGADLVGIGSMDRFEGAPEQSDPRRIFPEARSIIGLGFRIHRGLLRGIEEGTYFAGYAAMGYASINDVYAPIVLREVGNFIEDNGYEAVLYQNTSVRLGCGVGKRVSPDRPRPDVFLHFRIAAVICGMGEIGYSKLFLSPEFGPRQRLAFIITDAPLEPDPIFEGGICDRCMACVKECPAGAISAKETVKIEVAGKELEWGKLDEEKCGAVYQAGTPEYSPFMTDEVARVVRGIVGDKGNPPEQSACKVDVWSYLRENMQYVRNAWESYHPSTICGGRGCIRACMIHLERAGKISNVFKSPFRKREPWRLG
ncbi:MAG: epoxyqueuosine reductase [Candidatus Brockarchaeota archaeon]|nr:epoxyqueuosine reductase [Candidatus Brockarchaeota archaeon]